MKYVNLGRSGLQVSRLCLGCMSYGEPERLPQPWSLNEKASRPLIRQALEAGINFFSRMLVMHHLAHKLELPIAKKGFINLVITRHKPGALLPRVRARFRRDSSWCRLIA